MVELTPEMRAAAAEADGGNGIDPGILYKQAAGWPRGTKLIFTDTGIFAQIPGVPGAYLLADGRKVQFH